LENLTLPKNDNANENDKILQTQLTRNFAKRKRANFENLQTRPRTTAKRKQLCKSKLNLNKNAGEKR